jgi:hypothetical protein
MHEVQEKQSGIVFSLFKIASIAVVGHALVQASQPMQVS